MSDLPKVTLEGITQKGKNRVSELGAEWVITDTKDEVMFSNEPGPWLMICPANDIYWKACRWVHQTNDKNFKVTTHP